MLATFPRAAPRAARRLTTAHALRSPLAPTYNHSVRPALAPPYNHPLAHVPEEQRLKAPYAFSLLREHVSEPIGPTPTEWVASLLETQDGRQWAEDTWAKTLKELSEQVSCFSLCGRSDDDCDRPGDKKASPASCRSSVNPEANSRPRDATLSLRNMATLTTSPFPPRSHSRPSARSSVTPTRARLSSALALLSSAT